MLWLKLWRKRKSRCDSVSARLYWWMKSTHFQRIRISSWTKRRRNRSKGSMTQIKNAIFWSSSDSTQVMKAKHPANQNQLILSKECSIQWLGWRRDYHPKFIAQRHWDRRPLLVSTQTQGMQCRVLQCFRFPVQDVPFVVCLITLWLCSQVAWKFNLLGVHCASS